MGSDRPLVGRQRELEQLAACLDSARSGSAAIALVRGESGIGKSRLVGQLADDARTAGVFVAVGHCAPVSGGELPFGPFVEILSHVDATPEAWQRVAGSTWELLRSALTVSAPVVGSGSPDVGLERSRLFTSMLWLVHNLSEHQPVLLVVEDLHWADSSSLDLLNYIARTATRERLLLALTFRDNTLAGASDFRRAVGELNRSELSVDIPLEPLSPEQLRDLLATSGRRLEDARRERVVELADGNPFIALELAAHDGLEGTHTEALRHALLGPVDELPAKARAALQVAAVLGEFITSEVLERAVEHVGGDVSKNLRLLTERGLLVASEEGYSFRHAILRESVVRELLHGERRAAHRAAAEGVRHSGLDGTPAGMAQLAHHLVAAGEYAAALPVVVSAAEAARCVYAFAEARHQLSVARQVLWKRVEDPEALSQSSFDELVRREAEMARWAGEPSAAADLLRKGLAHAPRDGLARARLELELAEALWAAGDPAATLAACERAEVALEQGAQELGRSSPTVPDQGAVAGGPGGQPPRDQVVRVRLLAALAQALVVTGQYERGREKAEQAIELARSCGASRTALQARITLATATARQGELESGIRQLRQCLAEAVAAEAFKAVVRCFGNLAFLYSTAGRFEDVLQVSQQAAEECRRFGPLLLIAPTLAENWVAALVATGRWDEAELRAQELEQQWTTEGMALTLHLQLVYVAAARGDDEGVAAQLAIVDRFDHGDDPYTLHDVTVARAEHLLWRGQAAEAHRLVRSALGQLVEQQDAGMVVSLCSVALRAHADAVSARADRFDRHAALAETSELLSLAQRAGGQEVGALERAHLLLCEAEAARASRTPATAQWTAVVEEWERLGCSYPAAYARWHLAEELFGARARSQGTSALAAALGSAIELRSRPLEESLRTLARHAGVSEVDLAPAPAADGVPAESLVRTVNDIPVHLTRRELDVLRLLTQGHSNQQIARRLFITESTASVHVSHVIAKLGVSNRLQAAAAAQRLNLFPDESAHMSRSKGT